MYQPDIVNYRTTSVIMNTKLHLMNASPSVEEPRLNKRQQFVVPHLVVGDHEGAVAATVGVAEGGVDRIQIVVPPGWH
jgi:hypothetical protein